MRIVGKRQPRQPTGEPEPPTEADRDWSRSLGRAPGYMPKGVYRYATHKEANRDQEKWLAERMAKADLAES